MKPTHTASCPKGHGTLHIFDEEVKVGKDLKIDERCWICGWNLVLSTDTDELTPNDPSLKKFELDDLLWREYDFIGRVYRINNPVAFWYRENGETHRVLDSEGIIHIVPAPGVHGCVVRYAKTEGAEKVLF